MARRRRAGTVGFDQKVVQDVGMAALAVRILPLVVSNFFPLDQTLYTAVGAGTGYLIGTFLKNKTMANASIALGLVEFIAPAVENIIGGYGGGMEQSTLIKKSSEYSLPPIKHKMQVISDYGRLNDYTNDISPQSVKVYSDSY